ncbi:M13 family metallopeptidase [Vibrio natriegens]|uniref:M13 family metallopeptidase n=1 Tax=Vibrio natriegens TaxID=691 RepID=UPI001EFEAD2F|nr:M13 family metallopeptidase [Vibrio natriegens]MCG9699114.1 M13 family metallopeptidase [Vibrio natriegens]
MYMLRFRLFPTALILSTLLLNVASASSTKPQFGTWGVDLDGMDSSVKPGDDFYSYVNGTWHEKAEIASDAKFTGPASELGDLAFEQVKVLLEEAADDTKAAKGSDRQKIGDWYASMMDEEKLTADGLTPIQADLDRIQAIRDRTALADLLADNLSSLGAVVVGVTSEFDKKNPGKSLPAIVSAGMSLPARDLYLKDEYTPIREKFVEHVARVFEIAGMVDVDMRAKRVLELETEFAEVTLPPEELRDPNKMFNPTPTSKLPQIAPGIDWKRFLERTGFNAPEVVDIKVKSTITGLTKLIAEAPLELWRDYFTYKLIGGVEEALPQVYRDEFFDFYGKLLGGQPEPDPRWKVVLKSMGWNDKPLADAIGREFIKRYVPVETRPQTQEMVENLLKAFDARLAKLKWMTPQTRAEAQEKLAKTSIKVVYPDYWESTDDLEIVRGDAIGNFKRGAAFVYRQNLSELTTYPDKRKFYRPVYQVNAYANADWNEIVFLAAIIRPPFFDPNADPAVNYGAMGQVIGHEISHLFDDQGRQYDGDGMLRDWWQPEDAKQFEAVANRMVEQMGSYEPLPGKKVNGKLTLGESLADVAGLTVAYDAYRLSLDGKEALEIDGFTGDQRFFIGYAQAWRWKARDAWLEQLMKMDVHPPSHLRPQTVRNLDAWYKAFDVQPENALYLKPEERVQPW